MSRRPSFPHLARDEDAVLIPVEPGTAQDDYKTNRRKQSISLSGVGQADTSIKVDWSNTLGSTFAPLLGKGDKDKDEGKGGYLQLAMDEIPPVSPTPEQPLSSL